MKILGIDEAGRGSAIGSMIIAGVLYDEEVEDNLRAIGVRDSKKLSPPKRRNLEVRIKECVIKHWIIEVTVSSIDRSNLNKLEFEAFASIIRDADAEKVYIDAPVQNIYRDNFVARIRDSIGKETHIIAENNADATYTCVGAASILAKVERDRLIEGLHKIYGDFGSGYPGDEKTRVFISEWHRFPEIIRKRWEPVKEAIVTRGRIMVIGAVDTGKTNFVKGLVNIGLKKNMTVGVIDLDPGQSHVGQSGTIGFGIPEKRLRRLEQIAPLMSYPIFSLSPSGCEERIIRGIEWLMKRIPQVDLLLIDTTGYIRNLDFKISKVKTIKPDRVVVLERGNELAELKKRLDSVIYSIPVYEEVRKKSKAKRMAFRGRRSSSKKSSDVVHGNIKH